jgi:hypothetical protein
VEGDINTVHDGHGKEEYPYVNNEKRAWCWLPVEMQGLRNLQLLTNLVRHIVDIDILYRRSCVLIC